MMQEYSIKDLETFTGIKAHTIRIWEQRYGILEPKRTSTNIRYYTDADLKKLLNVGLLNQLGYKISKISELEEEEIQELIKEESAKDSQEHHYLNMLKISMLNYDEDLFYSVTNTYIEEHGVEQTFTHLFIPFLTQVGILWLTSTICPAQEHFVSNLIRQKLFSLIDQLDGKSNDEDVKYVMYLPQGEIHEISLLLVHYIIRKRGHRSLFLGQSVPFEDLFQIVKKYPDVSFVSYSTTSPSTKHVAQYLDRINREFQQFNCKFHIAGRMLTDVKSPNENLIQVYENGGQLMSGLFAQ